MPRKKAVAKKVVETEKDALSPDSAIEEASLDVSVDVDVEIGSGSGDSGSDSGSGSGSDNSGSSSRPKTYEEVLNGRHKHLRVCNECGHLLRTNRENAYMCALARSTCDFIEGETAKR